MRKRCTEFYDGESFRRKIRDIYLPASRFININHLQKKKTALHVFPLRSQKCIYNARAQVITFARLRFVRFAMDSCQPFGRINIIEKFDFALVFSSRLSFSFEELLKMAGFARFTRLPSY